LISLGSAMANFGVKRNVMRPLVRSQIARAGLGLLPMTGFISVALGMIIVAQTVYLLNRVGSKDLVGTVMVTVVVRELGPLVTALLVLGRVGAAAVIELGTARAHGEVESLEALGIDPIHYLVAPRVLGMAVSTFSLTIYSVAIALASGYLFAFLENVPLQPMDYVGQLVGAMRWEDFVLLTVKTLGFGVLIAVISCYQGLAQPLAIEDVAGATTRAVSHSIVGCVILDVLIIIVYLLL
jgi:phospholipid/cholesterol/gamma-HCH transport system permease protein